MNVHRGVQQDVIPTDGAAVAQTGFGNELQSEALPGALPIGQNSPQQPAYGLVSELVSGTSFAAPRAYNRRTYLFRARPSVIHDRFASFDNDRFLTPPLPVPPAPNQLRWDPWPMEEAAGDFIDGIATLCGNGDPTAQSGMAMHVYRARRSMDRRCFANADGEMLIIPDLGRLSIATEMGVIELAPSEFALIPRGIKFRVDLFDAEARGFVCENYGLPFRLPELGLIGSNGLANAADFEMPGAAFEISDEPYELIHKFAGRLWRATSPHSPFDVVAWRGSYLPAKFDMTRFVAMGTATVDHPDPSIFCALTSPGDPVMGGNADFMILPPRWLVAEHSFRPPGFHRNCVAEFLAVVVGQHDGKAHGFAPGGASLHNHWAAHGPDSATLEAARTAPLAPRKVEDSLVFMVETRMPLQLSSMAAEAPQLQAGYREGWQQVKMRFPNG